MSQSWLWTGQKIKQNISAKMETGKKISYVNSQYKLISNLISTKSDRDFNILINNAAGNIKNLILSESKKAGFTVDIDEVYSKRSRRD